MKNYYKMEASELDSMIAKMREWLWEYRGNPKEKEVYQALKAALNAKELREMNDDHINAVLDILT